MLQQPTAEVGTAVHRRVADGVRELQPPTLGLRENEMRVATRMIKRGLPCLQLYGEPAADVRVSDRHADIYDSYADMFTVLVVRTFKLQKSHGCCC